MIKQSNITWPSGVAIDKRLCMLVWKQAAVMIAGSCRVRVKSAQCFLIDARYGLQVAASVFPNLLMPSPSPKRRAVQSDSLSGCCDHVEHRGIIAGMSHLGRAMAFAARVWDANGGRFVITLDDVKWYSKRIDTTINIEQELICKVNLPTRRFTIGYVEELLASSKSPSDDRGAEATIAGPLAGTAV